MQRANKVIELDHHHIEAAHCAASAIQDPLAMPPAFLSMPNWTVEETAHYFRCQAQSIRSALAKKGTFHGLKPRRFGRRWYFSAAEARALMEAA